MNALTRLKLLCWLIRGLEILGYIGFGFLLGVLFCSWKLGKLL
jgi:hypothetical protein